MAAYRILSWHGLPVGVKARDEAGEVRENLPHRFQVAVDAVATATGHMDRARYLAGFQWSASAQRDGPARAVAQAVAAEIAAEFTPEIVKQLRAEIEKSLAAHEG